MEGEASCGSVSDIRRSGNVPRRLLNWRNDRSDMKGKRVVDSTRRGGLRRRRRVGINGGNYYSVSSHDPSSCVEVQDGAVPVSPSSINMRGNELSEGISLPVDNEDDAHNFECEFSWSLNSVNDDQKMTIKPDDTETQMMEREHDITTVLEATADETIGQEMNGDQKMTTKPDDIETQMMDKEHDTTIQSEATADEQTKICQEEYLIHALMYDELIF
ncbi:unnamed protein product [Fraxinus pennsylvanica]|uniref:Uncharacterized protein n=1 Tax=Fraxinus pennsylvanica TaxID=56036 RepID=A0AAD2DNR3_9LAMI|nr:unnamed protein product [Fraxinus pennsylvanica]